MDPYMPAQSQNEMDGLPPPTGKPVQPLSSPFGKDERGGSIRQQPLEKPHNVEHITEPFTGTPLPPPPYVVQQVVILDAKQFGIIQKKLDAIHGRLGMALILLALPLATVAVIFLLGSLS